MNSLNPYTEIANARGVVVKIHDVAANETAERTGMIYAKRLEAAGTGEVWMDMKVESSVDVGWMTQPPMRRCASDRWRGSARALACRFRRPRRKLDGDRRSRIFWVGERWRRERLRVGDGCGAGAHRRTRGGACGTRPKVFRRAVAVARWRRCLTNRSVFKDGPPNVYPTSAAPWSSRSTGCGDRRSC